MGDKKINELVTELKWMVDNRWMSAEHHEDAKRLAKEIAKHFPSTEPTVGAPEDVTEVSSTKKQKEFEPPKWLMSGVKMPIVGRRFTRESFIQYVKWVQKHEKYSWSPSGITMHHTGFPDLATRPNGFIEQHMINMRHGYRKKGWSHGPHIYTDDKGIWVFNPLSQKGTHAVQYNNTRYGIEMLGNYDTKKDLNDPRGKLARENGAFAAAVLMKYAKISTSKLNFHRFDPHTNKNCPGKLIKFQEFEDGVLKIYNKL